MAQTPRALRAGRQPRISRSEMPPFAASRACSCVATRAPAHRYFPPAAAATPRRKQSPCSGRGSERTAGTAEEPGTKPVLGIVTKRCTLTVFRLRRVLRNNIKCQLEDRGQSLAGVLFHIPDGVLLVKGLDLLRSASICARKRGWQRPSSHG